MTQAYEGEVTTEQIEMLMLFDRFRTQIAARLHPAWDVADDGMAFRSIPGDGPQDLNSLLLWFDEKQSKIAEAMDAFEELCCEAAGAKPLG